jgi:phosphatidylglycerophosphatase A
MIKNFNTLFLNLFNVGKVKYAPGTLASLVTCLLFLILINFFSLIILFYATLFIFAYSFFAINNSFDSFKADDPQEIVIDEVVGQMIPLLAIPIYETLYFAHSYLYILCAFILFRLFDIWKPFPISYIDNNTKGALGIMLDDIFAGLFSVITMISLFFFLGS